MGGQLRQAEPATKGDGGTDKAGGLKLLSAAGDGMKRGRAGVDKVDKGESLLRTGRGRGRHRRQLHRKKGWWLERTEMARARGLQRTASRLDRVGQGVGLRRPPAALVLGAIRLVRPSLPCRQDRRQARSSRRARRRELGGGQGSTSRPRCGSCALSPSVACDGPTMVRRAQQRRRPPTRSRLREALCSLPVSSLKAPHISFILIGRH
jgi:hypothetical protein